MWNERRGLCHNEIKGLGRKSLLGAQKEARGSAKAPAVPKEKHLLIRYTFHPDVWVPCSSACVALLITVSGNTSFLPGAGRQRGRDLELRRAGTGWPPSCRRLGVEGG